MTGSRLTWRTVRDKVLTGREATTIGGWLAIKLVSCPTCASPANVYCLSLYGQRQQTNGVHAARSEAAARYLSDAMLNPKVAEEVIE